MKMKEISSIEEINDKSIKAIKNGIILMLKSQDDILEVLNNLNTAIKYCVNKIDEFKNSH